MTLRVKNSTFIQLLISISFIVSVLCVCVLPAYADLSAAEKKNSVSVDADSITYTENEGVAVATGNVRIKNNDIILKAPRVTYNASNFLLEAFSEDGKKVYFYTALGERLEGTYMKYNVSTKRGTMTNCTGGTDVLYLKGENVNVMSYEEANRSGIIKTKHSKKALEDTELIGEWLNVSSTTCDFDTPHYRLHTRRAIIIPNKKIILKQPDIFIEEHRLFRYPFDYIIALRKREQSIMPVFKYESNKGAGLGARGVFDLEKWGELSVGFTGWTEDLLEARIRYENEIFDRFYVYGETNRRYNRDDKTIMWRPKWGAFYNMKGGWRASIDFSQRELIETSFVPGMKQRFNVWKEPEFTLSTPVWGPSYARISAKAQYGRYQDNIGKVMPWTERLEFEANLRGSLPVILKKITPYYGVNYTYDDYEHGDQTQKYTDAYGGISWKIGAFSFNSMYARRWVDGASKLYWDRYYDREDFYQTISFPLPFGADWEKFNFSATATFDITRDRLAEMIYVLDYNRHCTTWQIWARDQKAGDEIDFRLTFYINAFPDKKIILGTEEKNDYGY